MNTFKNLTISACIGLIISIVMSFILIGCTTPSNNNHNNINVNVGAGESQKQENPHNEELIRNCTPRSKCPHLWRWMDTIKKGKTP